jgi:CHAT domain-containing protein
LQLVLLLDTPEVKPTPEESLVWVVTRTESRWVRSELGKVSLKREVAALRCGLDYDDGWGARGSRCSELLKVTYSAADRQNDIPLPFDLGRAHALYTAFFGQVEDLIKDKQLLIVPSGALTQLPFQVLVTKEPDPALKGADAWRQASWLIRTHALTVVPSVSSLKALRVLAKASQASRPLIGFGNPLLDGASAEDRDWAKAARAKQSCSIPLEQQIASLAGERRGVLPLKLRGGLADVAQIRSLVPLPETADELCAVAHDLRGSAMTTFGSAPAPPRPRSNASARRETTHYRIVYFATHGTLAGHSAAPPSLDCCSPRPTKPRRPMMATYRRRRPRA